MTQQQHANHLHAQLDSAPAPLGRNALCQGNYAALETTPLGNSIAKAMPVGQTALTRNTAVAKKSPEQITTALLKTMNGVGETAQKAALTANAL